MKYFFLSVALLMALAISTPSFAQYVAPSDNVLSPAPTSGGDAADNSTAPVVPTSVNAPSIPDTGDDAEDAVPTAADPNIPNTGAGGNALTNYLTLFAGLVIGLYGLKLTRRV